MILAAVALGLLIGLAMGALGGGGSILTVPVLVFLLGLSTQEATTASLVIVGMAAATASLSHARSHHTCWGVGGLLALIGVPAAVLGTVLNRRLDADVLLLCFALVMLLAAVGMLVRARAVARGRTTDRSGSPASVARTGAGVAVRVAAAGLGIGFLTGFLGVGGGFVVVPVLVVLLGIPMPTAVGTSLLVISLNAAVALGARAGEGGFVWEVIAPFTVAAVVGSLAGKRIADRLSAATLTLAFAVLLVVVAVYVAVRAGLALT